MHPVNRDHPDKVNGATRGAAVDSYPRDALPKAAAAGRLDIVQALLAQGVTTEGTDKSGRTAIMVSAIYGHTKIVQALLGAGANTEATNRDGWTALAKAACNGDLPTTLVLITAGAQVNTSDVDQWTPLMWAAIRNKANIVRALLAGGADPTYRNTSGNTAEDLSVGDKNQEAGRILRAVREHAGSISAVSIPRAAPGAPGAPGTGIGQQTPKAQTQNLIPIPNRAGYSFSR